MSIMTPVRSGVRRAAVPPFPVCQLSVDEYHRAITAGIYSEDDHVELIRGWVVPKMPQNPPHKQAIPLAQIALTKILPAGWHLLVQQPIGAPESEPEPDLAVARGSPRDYPDGTPKPPNVGLVVEVSESSLDYARTTKKELYAEAGFPIYWIINLISHQVEVYSAPTGSHRQPDYQKHGIYDRGNSVSLILDSNEVGQIAVRDLLP
jgi:hypothetical protein